MKPSRYWTKEKCLEQALKYDTRLTFRMGAPSAYNSAHRNGWLEDMFKHMPEYRKPHGYWNNKDHVIAEAVKYSSVRAFRKGCSGAYNAAERNDWFKEVNQAIYKRKVENL